MTQPTAGGEVLDLTPEELSEAEKLHAEEYDKVRRRVVKIDGISVQDSEDITAEAFIKILRSWRMIKDPAKRGGYFSRTAMNLAMSSLRRRRTVRTAESKAAEPDWGSPSAEAELDRKEMIKAVRAAVATLPGQKSREVLTYQCEGLEDEEIAKVTGKSEATVRSQRSKSLPRLRESLSDYGRAGE